MFYSLKVHLTEQKPEPVSEGEQTLGCILSTFHIFQSRAVIIALGRPLSGYATTYNIKHDHCFLHASPVTLLPVCIDSQKQFQIVTLH